MSLPANMQAQAATGSTTWARCVRIVTRDGLTIALTEHDRSLSVDLGDGKGTITYSPSDGVSLSAGRVGGDLAVDNIEIIGAVDDARIVPEDAHGGRFDGASVVLFELDWENPSGGQNIYFAGTVGEVRSSGDEFVFELRSIAALMQRPIAQTIGAMCRKSFGSTAASERTPNTACGVDLAPPSWQASTAYTATEDGDRLVGSRVKPTTANGWWYRCTVAGTSGASEPAWPITEGATVTDGTVTWKAERALSWSGTVSAVLADRQFTATGISVEAKFFERGRVVWTGGANAGKSVQSAVAADDGAGKITLYRAPIEPIAVNDTFTIERGCDRSHAACIAFSNWLNFNGFPYVPKRDL